MEILEEEMAFLSRVNRMGYNDFMCMPISRRKRLVEWVTDYIERQKAKGG